MIWESYHLAPWVLPDNDLTAESMLLAPFEDASGPATHQLYYHC